MIDITHVDWRDEADDRIDYVEYAKRRRREAAIRRIEAALRRRFRRSVRRNRR